MLERQRPLGEQSTSGPQGLGDIFAVPETPGLVTCVHGHYCEQLPLANMTVAQIRARFHDRFDLHPESQAVLDGTEVSGDTVVRAGQLLMFTNRSGEKGISPPGRDSAVINRA